MATILIMALIRKEIPGNAELKVPSQGSQEAALDVISNIAGVSILHI
jgi:hypothetical protein